jgi:hypothetical protein
MCCCVSDRSRALERMNSPKQQVLIREIDLAEEKAETAQTALKVEIIPAQGSVKLWEYRMNSAPNRRGSVKIASSQ